MTQGGKPIHKSEIVHDFICRSPSRICCLSSASYQRGTALIELFNKMNEVFARQTSYHLVRGMKLSDGNFTSNAESRFDNDDKKKRSPTVNKQMIE